ncbi:MAG: hypothetical protein QXE05_08295 [Nitrososphaeria archaeon]
MEELIGTDVLEKWKRIGFKFQVAAEHLLKKTGYRILKAQQDLGLRKSAKAFKRIINPCTIGEYLWNYSDYIVAKKNLVYIIDVKTKPYVRLKIGGKWTTFLDKNFSFTKKEIEFYGKSSIPVLILIIIYQDSDDLKKLGPAYYRLVQFKDFRFAEGWEGGFLPRNDVREGCKKLTSLEIYDILLRAKALDVIEVGPGYIRKCANYII